MLLQKLKKLQNQIYKTEWNKEISNQKSHLLTKDKPAWLKISALGSKWNSYGKFAITVPLLHQLNEDQLLWRQQFKHLNLSNDEAKALVLIKEIGAIDNSALRAITDLDTLQTSQLLRKLWQQLGLIEKGGRGSASYYKPSAQLHLMISTPKG